MAFFPRDQWRMFRTTHKKYDDDDDLIMDSMAYSIAMTDGVVAMSSDDSSSSSDEDEVVVAKESRERPAGVEMLGTSARGVLQQRFLRSAQRMTKDKLKKE